MILTYSAPHTAATPAPVLRRLIREALACLYALSGPADPLVTLTARLAGRGTSRYLWPTIQRALELELGPAAAEAWVTRHTLGALADWTVARAKLSAVRLAAQVRPAPGPCGRCGSPRAWQRPYQAGPCPVCGQAGGEGV